MSISGLKFAVGYFAFCLVVGILTIFVFLISPEPTFADIGIMLVTLPWSLILLNATNSAGAFYFTIAMALAALINSAILYAFGYLMDSKTGKSKIINYIKIAFAIICAITLGSILFSNITSYFL